MAIAILLFIIGLVILIAAAEFLVRGAASISRKLGISAMAVGLTVVAFGTSAPELVVNVVSALEGNAAIALGNVVGSNIANILLILGISAMIRPLSVNSNTVWKEIPFALLAMILVLVMGNDILLDGAANNLLSRTDGFLLISMLIIFLYYVFGMAKQDVNAPVDEVKLYSTSWSVGFVLAGLVGLFFGGKLLVDNAVILARLAGLSEAFIGLTIVAVGTSLPELATSVVATYRGQKEIAVGNIIGSNIFNIFWILGFTSTLLQLPFNSAINFDVLLAVIVTSILFLALFVGKRRSVDRWQGALFVILYVVYLAYIILRG